MSKVIGVLVAVVGVLLLVAGLTWMVVLLADASMHFYWTRYEFGYRAGDGNSPHYLFYSGFGSIILPPIITLFGAALLYEWHNQCHVTGCYWPTRRITAANEKVCWRHAPHKHRTAKEIREAHHLYLGKNIGNG